MDCIDHSMSQSTVPSDRISTILLGRNQLICLSQKPTDVTARAPPDNPIIPLRAAEKGPMTRKSRNLLEINLEKQKKAAEKDARLIKLLSTVIALNPYQFPVASHSCTSAWRRAAECLIEENVLENTHGARSALQRRANRCVTEYKSNFVIPEATRRPNRELTEIETLAKEIYQLQEDGAPNPMRTKAQQKSLNIAANYGAGSGSGQNREDAATGGISSNSLLVQCGPSEEADGILPPSPSSGVKKLPILRPGSITPAPAAVQYFVLCPAPVTQQPSPTVPQGQPDPKARSVNRKPRKPGARWKCALCPYRPSASNAELRSVYRFPKDDLRQKKWIKVCRGLDHDFKLCHESFICEAHFAPESFGVRRVRNGVESRRLQWFAVPSLHVAKQGDSRNYDTAFESDEEMEIEEEVLEYDNGLPTAPDFPSGLPNTERDCEKRLLFEEGKENICEHITCSTCGVSQEPCWNHAKFIEDKNTKPLALSSLPGQLDFKTDGNTRSPLGILSRVSLRSHTVFGPVRGALCSHISSRFAVHDSTSVKCYHLDSDDTCNWMKYVQFGHDAQDQNLAVYFKDGLIFFVTTRDVQPDEELRLWYSRKYADSLGFVRKDGLNLAKAVADGTSVEDDGRSQKDDAEVVFAAVFAETGETEENDFALLDFDEIMIQDFVEDAEEQELSLDAAEHRAPPHVNQMERRKTVRSINERTDNRTDQEMTPVVGQTVTAEEQSTILSYLHPTFDADSSENNSTSSENVPSDEPEKSDRISATGRKNVKSGPVKRGRPEKITFGCVECRLEFPTEHILLLHNYQHSRAVNSDERTCPKCGDTFDDLGGLSLHVKEHGKKYIPKEAYAQCDALIARSTMTQLWRQHPEQSGPLTGKYPSSKQSMSLPDACFSHALPPTCDGGFSADALKSFDELPASEPETPDRIAVTEHRKAKTGPSKKKYLPQDTSSKIKFRCSECRIHFPTQQLLTLHNYQHSNGYSGERTCPKCGSVFENLNGLSQHVREHAKRYFPREKCIYCDTPISSWAMELHVRHFHPEHSVPSTEKYPCKKCGMEFDTWSSCRTHTRTHNLQTECIYCGRTEVTNAAMDEHVILHRERDGFHCPKCPKLCLKYFHLKRHYESHSRVHQNKKPKETEETSGLPQCEKPEDADELEESPKLLHKKKYRRTLWLLPNDEDETAETTGLLPRKKYQKKKPKDADETVDTTGLLQSKKLTSRNIPKLKKFYVDPSTKIKFPCAICHTSYKTEAVLEVHRLFHETESDKSYNGDDIDKACPECAEEFDTVDALFRHVEGYGVFFHSKEQCPVCEKFISSRLMKRHMEGNHPSGQTEEGEQFTCKVCKKVFPSEIKHRAHVQVHKPKQCLLCAEIFEVWGDLGRHAINVHRQADGFHCPSCDGVYQTFRHMTTHHRTNHDIRSIVTCEICGKMCKNKARLHAHMNVEHGSKEFTHECDVCGKKFMRYGTLRNHVSWAHTAVGRKKVQDTQVAFMKKGYVAPRKRMLLEEFPFKCETCQVGFLTEGRILRHNDKFHPDEA